MRTDEPKEHLSANRSEWTISQFSVPVMLLEEQIQKEQQCTDVSDFSISLTISRLRLD
jgi:hypothetical protein